MDWRSVADDVIVALLPMLTAALLSGVGAAFAWLRAHSKLLAQSKAFSVLNELASQYVTAASVATVNQLKQDGRWGPKEAAKIKDAVAAKILKSLPDDERKVLEAITDDLGGLIGAKIEGAVAANQAAGIQAKVAKAAAPPSQPPAASAQQTSA